jgi:hypothetical protein
VVSVQWSVFGGQIADCRWWMVDGGWGMVMDIPVWNFLFLISYLFDEFEIFRVIRFLGA